MKAQHARSLPLWRHRTRDPYHMKAQIVRSLPSWKHWNLDPYPFESTKFCILTILKAPNSRSLSFWKHRTFDPYYPDSTALDPYYIDSTELAILTILSAQNSRSCNPYHFESLEPSILTTMKAQTTRSSPFWEQNTFHPYRYFCAGPLCNQSQVVTGALKSPMSSWTPLEAFKSAWGVLKRPSCALKGPIGTLTLKGLSGDFTRL